MSLVCSQSVNIKQTWTDGNNSIRQLKNALWHLGIYLSGLCITLLLSLTTWMATDSPFLANPVCCKVLAMSGANSHSTLFIFRDIKFTCSVKNENQLWRSLNQSCHTCFPNQDWRDATQYLVYMIARDKSSNQHLQHHNANPQTRKSTSAPSRNPTYNRRMNLLFSQLPIM